MIIKTLKLSYKQTYRPCWGPTLPLSNDEEALMSLSVMAPFSIPSGAIHCAAKKWSTIVIKVSLNAKVIDEYRNYKNRMKMVG